MKSATNVKEKEKQTMVRNAIADTAVIAFTVASLAVVTAKGEELGKAQLELIKEVQSSLQKGNN